MARCNTKGMMGLKEVTCTESPDHPPARCAQRRLVKPLRTCVWFPKSWSRSFEKLMTIIYKMDGPRIVNYQMDGLSTLSKCDADGTNCSGDWLPPPQCSRVACPAATKMAEGVFFWSTITGGLNVRFSQRWINLSGAL
jgi:hypothetical protein